MKKIITILLLNFSILLVGCGGGPTAPKEITEPKTLNAADVFKVDDKDKGIYTFTVLDSKYLGPHSGDDLNQERVQIEWEVENINFNGQAVINGESLNNVVDLEASAFTVKDDKGYVLETMSTGWEGDFINDSKPVPVKSKMKKKYTWILQNRNTSFLTISYNRMNDVKQEFKVFIKQ